MSNDFKPLAGESLAAFVRRVRPDLDAIRNDGSLTAQEQRLFILGGQFRMLCDVYEEHAEIAPYREKLQRVRDEILTRQTPHDEANALVEQTKLGFQSYLDGLDEGVDRAGKRLVESNAGRETDPVSWTLGFSRAWIERSRLAGTDIPRGVEVRSDRCVNCGGPNPEIVEFAVVTAFATMTIKLNSGAICRPCAERASREIGGAFADLRPTDGGPNG